MTIVLREMTREAADAILAGERPGGVRVAEGYPTEFSVGVAQCVGAVGQFGPFFLQRSEDDVVVGEIGGAFVDEEGTIEIGYAVVESQWNRGYATAAVEALVTKAREASEVRRIVAHAPLERPESGRVLEKAGFAMVREIDDADEDGQRRARRGVGAGGLAPRRTSSRALPREAATSPVLAEPAGGNRKPHEEPQAGISRGFESRPRYSTEAPTTGRFPLSGLRVSRRGAQPSSPRQRSATPCGSPCGPFRVAAGMDAMHVRTAGRSLRDARGGIQALRGARHGALGLYALQVALVTAAYYLAGRIGLELAYLDGAVAAMWPPAGLGLAVLFLYGVRLWPGIVIGDLLLGDFSTPFGTVARPDGRQHAGGRGRRAAAAAADDGRAGARARLRRARAGGLRARGGAGQRGVRSDVAAPRRRDLRRRARARVPHVDAGRRRRRPRRGARAADVGRARHARHPRGASSSRAPSCWPLLVVLAELPPQRDVPYVVFPVLLWAALRLGPRGAATAVLVVCSITVWNTAQRTGRSCATRSPTACSRRSCSSPLRADLAAARRGDRRAHARPPARWRRRGGPARARRRAGGAAPGRDAGRRGRRAEPGVRAGHRGGRAGCLALPGASVMQLRRRAHGDRRRRLERRRPAALPGRHARSTSTAKRSWRRCCAAATPQRVESYDDAGGTLGRRRCAASATAPPWRRP